MKKTQVRHFPTNKRQPVSGTSAGDKRKMREAFYERMKLEAEFLVAATDAVQEIRNLFEKETT